LHLNKEGCMVKQGLVRVLVLVLALVASFSFVSFSFAELETQLGVNNSATTGSVPYQKTNWYGFSATAGQGYRVNLKPSSGNCDLYLFDTNFNLVASSKKSGTTQDPVWYGQSSSGPMHIASYGAYNPSSNFTVWVITSPYVQTMTPTTGPAGTLVTLTGFGFGATRGTSYVQFGSVQATSYSSWSNTQIKVYVPSGVASGTIEAVVYVSSKASNPINFTTGAISSDGTMYKYDLGRSGSFPNGPTTLPLNLKWSYSVLFNPGASSATVANNIAYVAADKLVALDATTGVLKWSFTLDMAAVSTPAVAGGIVYVVSGNGRFYALDANTGSLKWQFDGAYISGGYSAPAVSNGVVYFGGGKNGVNKLFALDAATGVLNWSYTVSSTTHNPSTPAIGNGVVYFGDGSKNIYALYADTGAVKWIYVTTDYGMVGTPALVNGVLYYASVAASGSAINALDVTTKVLKWRTPASGWLRTPVVANGVVYVNKDNGSLEAYDTNTGVFKWAASVGSNGCSSPSVSNGLVYIVGTDGNINVFDASTGAKKWSYVIGGSNDYDDNNAPALYNGKVYVASKSLGKVYCFGQ
jgi:outer membrane protein assembly factor BamB